MNSVLDKRKRGIRKGWYDSLTEMEKVEKKSRLLGREDKIRVWLWI